MGSSYDEIDLSRVKTVPIGDRGSKVSIDDFGKPEEGGGDFSRWIDSLPDQLAAESLRRLVERIGDSRSGSGREIIWMMGAHIVKCGLPPYIVALMERGFATAVAVNGAFAIHDIEIAFFGETSEDVPANLERGIFGFSGETVALLFDAVSKGRRNGWGLGESVGRYIAEKGAPNAGSSVLARGMDLEIPVTVHTAVGTDIVIQHPGYDGAAWGELSARDFRILCSRVESLGNNGGVVMNVGSAVILPEVFLKAFSVSRNLGAKFDSITSCNLDMIQHYRPGENVLRRPASFGGDSYAVTGHHELMIPLLYSCLTSGSDE